MQEGFAPYLRARVDWSSFERDLGRAERDPEFDRPAFLGVLARFFDTAQLSSDWDSLKEAEAELLINSLSILCPFDPEEKQALLEAPTLANRRETLVTLMEFALRSERRRGGDAVTRSPVDPFSPPADPGATVPHSLRGFVRRQVRARLPALGQARFRAYPRHARADYERTVPAAPPSASALARSSRRTGATQCVASAGSGGLSCHRVEAARRGGMPPVIRMIQPVIV